MIHSVILKIIRSFYPRWELFLFSCKKSDSCQWSQLPTKKETNSQGLPGWLSGPKDQSEQWDVFFPWFLGPTGWKGVRTTHLVKWWSWVFARGGRQPKHCSQTWYFGFQSCLGKHFQIHVDFNLGARQAEGLQSQSLRSPQELDRFPTDFVPFSGRSCLRSVFSPLFFSLLLRSDFIRTAFPHSLSWAVMFEIDVSLKCNLKKSETNRGENTDIKHNCPEKGIKSVGNSLSDLRLGRNQHAGQRYSSSQRFDSVWPDDGQCDLTMARARGWKDGWFVDPSTTPHDHTWSLLLTHAAQAQTKLENDACCPPFYSQNKRNKPAPNLNHFSRRVSCTHMVTLAHTYILTCTPHMCARTDYHSVYTHIHVNSVYQ